MDQLTDIVQAAKAGNKDAFNAIVHRFQDMAYGRALAWLGDHGRAQDAAQEAFVDAYLHLDQLRDPAAFPGWFGRIVVKHSDRQSRSMKPQVSLDDVPGLTSRAPDPLEVVHSRQMGQIIHDRISQLSDEHRDVITLFHLEEYTQQEVADFLDVPVSTVKKRLFDARKHLKRRMKTMTPPKVEQNRPSQDDDFKRRVAFFIALRTRDFGTLEKLIDEDATLLSATTDNDVAPEMYWSRDITAIFWAVQTSDQEMLAFLIDRGADVNIRVRRTETPLHHAVMMDEPVLAELLIRAGADIGKRAGCKQTVLHRATIGGNLRLVDLLISSGANLTDRDEEDRTAADWAMLKSRKDVLECLLKAGSPKPTVRKLETVPIRYVPDSCALNGRIVDVHGQPIDGLPSFTSFSKERNPVETVDAGPALETGIKGVDFFAPIKRGGLAGIDFCLGTGLFLLNAQIVHNFVMSNNGRVVYIGRPSGPPFLQYREFFYGTGMAFRGGVVFVVAKPDGSSSEQESAVTKGLEIANQFREAGYDVLVKIEGCLMRSEASIGLARDSAGVSSDGATTVLLTGSPPDGLLAIQGHLDSVTYMSPANAGLGLYPAIDEAHSRSRLLDEGAFDTSHTETVERVRQLLVLCDRFNLHQSMKNLGEDYIEMNDGGVSLDRVKRARRLKFFLTQGYHGTEMWTGRPGETVQMSHTVETCRRILDGEYADIPEKAWYMMGRMESILERAKTLED